MTGSSENLGRENKHRKLSKGCLLLVGHEPVHETSCSCSNKPQLHSLISINASFSRLFVDVSATVGCPVIRLTTGEHIIILIVF